MFLSWGWGVLHYSKLVFKFPQNLCFELGFGGYILIFINKIAEYDSMDEDPFGVVFCLFFFA